MSVLNGPTYQGVVFHHCVEKHAIVCSHCWSLSILLTLYVFVWHVTCAELLIWRGSRQWVTAGHWLQLSCKTFLGIVAFWFDAPESDLVRCGCVKSGFCSWTVLGRKCKLKINNITLLITCWYLSKTSRYITHHIISPTTPPPGEWPLRYSS